MLKDKFNNYSIILAFLSSANLSLNSDFQLAYDILVRITPIRYCERIIDQLSYSLPLTLSYVSFWKKIFFSSQREHGVGKKNTRFQTRRLIFWISTSTIYWLSGLSYIHLFKKYLLSLLCARHCARHWGYSSEKNKVPTLMEFIF